MKKKPKTRTCRSCGKRKAVEEFGKMPHAADGSKLNPNCRTCIGATLRKAKKKKPTDSEVNGIIANLATAVGSELMPVVNQVVRTMRLTGTLKLIVDVSEGYVEVVGPERLPLPEDK